jgi:hypothetical protein
VAEACVCASGAAGGGVEAAACWLGMEDGVMVGAEAGIAGIGVAGTGAVATRFGCELSSWKRLTPLEKTRTRAPRAAAVSKIVRIVISCE